MKEVANWCGGPKLEAGGWQGLREAESTEHRDRSDEKETEAKPFRARGAPGLHGTLSGRHGKLWKGSKGRALTAW